MLERRHVYVVVQRIDLIKDSQIREGIGKLEKTIRKSIMKDLKVNKLNLNMIYDRTLRRNLIYVVDLTVCDRA